MNNSHEFIARYHEGNYSVRCPPCNWESWSLGPLADPLEMAMIALDHILMSGHENPGALTRDADDLLISIQDFVDTHFALNPNEEEEVEEAFLVVVENHDPEF